MAWRWRGEGSVTVRSTAHRSPQHSPGARRTLPSCSAGVCSRRSPPVRFSRNQQTWGGEGRWGG